MKSFEISVKNMIHVMNKSNKAETTFRSPSLVHDRVGVYMCIIGEKQGRVWCGMKYKKNSTD